MLYANNAGQINETEALFLPLFCVCASVWTFERMCTCRRVREKEKEKGKVKLVNEYMDRSTGNKKQFFQYNTVSKNTSIF